MKDNTIILSIVIPVYNSGHFLMETINSIKNVNFSYPYEIILVDDGSTDSYTQKVLNNLDSDYIIIRQENQGVSKARNNGIAKAKGKYILPFDSDDLMNKNYYNLALQKMIENPSIDIVYGDYILFGDENRYNKSGKYNRLRLIYSGCYMPMAGIYKKEVWENNDGYDENLSYAEDWDFWSRSAVKNFIFFYINKPFYLYRRILNGNSLSQANIDSRNSDMNKLKSKIPSYVFNQESISDYVILSVKENKKLKIKLLLRIFCPGIFNLLVRKKIFMNGVIVQ